MSRRAVNLAWLAGYVVMLVAVVVLVLRVRESSLQEMSTPEARANWKAWREDKVNQPNTGPVSRRQPKSAEPPQLVLMRDHFAVVMTAALVFTSLLFGTMMIAIRGALGSARTDQHLTNGRV